MYALILLIYIFTIRTKYIEEIRVVIQRESVHDKRDDKSVHGLNLFPSPVLKAYR